MGIDYYAVLDIARSCSDVDIKLAYRKLALRTHPKRVDYQQHTKHFSTGSALPLPKLPVGVLWEYINESYEVLIDPLLRQIYDTFGEEGLKSGVFCPNGSTKPFAYHGDCMKTFRNFFGTYSPYADLIDAVNPTIYNPGGTALKVKDKDIESLLYLNLKEVFFGGSKTIKISRYEFVDDFKTKTEKRDRFLKIQITPGILPGTRLTFESAGDQSPTRFSADIIFTVCDEVHPIFHRQNGKDLLMTYKITLAEALTGFTILLDTIDGRKLNIGVRNVVNPNYVKIIHSEGLPNNNNIQERGDLHIKFEVEFPKYVPKTIKEKLKETFRDLE